MRHLLYSLILCPLIVLIVSCNPGETTVDKSTKDGILLMGNGTEPKSLDPHVINGVSESNIVRALFEGLCLEHPSDDSLSLPGGAESWVHNEDFTVWSFKLNPLATWSDGVPVTAMDFTFAYERLLSPNNSSAPFASMLFHIQNAEQFNAGELENFYDVGVKAIGEFELEISLKAPVPFLPQLTQFYPWFPVPKHKVLEYGGMTEPYTAWTYEGNLVSNGPFMLKTRRQNHYIEVVKNPHYWDAEQVALNGIKYFPIKNVNTEARMFLNNQLHLTYKMPSDLIASAVEEYPEQTRQEMYVGTRFVRCNTTRPFTAKREVRHALSLAIDREALVKHVLQGGQQVAGSITPPFGGYKPESKTSFNPEQARDLLKQAGYANADSLPEINILSTDSAEYSLVAEALQAMWREHLGLRVRIIKREWKSYNEMRKKLEFDLLSGAWVGDYLDPTTFLELWNSNSANNLTGWKDEQYDTLLDNAAAIQDPAARYNKLLEAEAYAMDALPAIPVHHYTTNYFISPDVRNWHPLLLNNHPYKFVELIGN